MSTLRTNQILDANGGNTATINGMTPTGLSLQGFRNRLINSDFRIDQRNAGASVTQTTGTVYTVDRWWCFGNAASKFTVQRSTTAPAGFTNSLLCTSSSAYTPTSTQEFDIAQYIEGFNVADLGWGVAGAQTVTLSFQVRSSLTGTFGGQIANGTSARSYPFSYTISAANTWETKTVTIPGDTTGTWATDNSAGILVLFSLGAGSSKSGTANTWQAGNYTQPTGATSVVGTNGATWYITGVQLEAGSVATPFERRDYGRELAMCQRYYYRRNYAAGRYVANLQAYSASAVYGKLIDLPVTMRATPTANLSAIGSFISTTSTGSSSTAFTGGTISNTTVDQLSTGGLTGSSGLTAGNASVVSAGVDAWIDASAEL